MVQNEIENKHRKDNDEENCPICMCELYEGLMTKTADEIKLINEKQIERKEPIDVVVMSRCTDHCYHKECIQNQQGTADCIRCAVCAQIYGVYTGKMPKGTMKWNLLPAGHMPLDTYEKLGTWIIDYSFPNGTQENGTPYRGTGR